MYFPNDTTNRKDGKNVQLKKKWHVTAVEWMRKLVIWFIFSTESLIYLTFEKQHNFTGNQHNQLAELSFLCENDSLLGMQGAAESSNKKVHAFALSCVFVC